MDNGDLLLSPGMGRLEFTVVVEIVLFLDPLHMFFLGLYWRRSP
jgi:hypothetical protein